MVTLYDPIQVPLTHSPTSNAPLPPHAVVSSGRAPAVFFTGRPRSFFSFDTGVVDVTCLNRCVLPGEG